MNYKKTDTTSRYLGQILFIVVMGVLHSTSHAAEIMTLAALSHRYVLTSPHITDISFTSSRAADLPSLNLDTLHHKPLLLAEGVIPSFSEDTTPLINTTTMPSETEEIGPAIIYADEPYESYEPLPPVIQKDPFEGFNRAMFTFNDKLDIYLLKPIATLYNKIMPRPLNQGIHNVFFNINTLPTIANDVLQANFYQAANDVWRVGINTTIGIGGLFDVAQRMNLEPYSNDFGLTMARWGYADSNYLVLPFFGANTVRDALGIPVDYFGFSIYPYINPQSTRYQLYGLGIIDRRAQLLKFQEVLEEASLDKYIFVRSAYMQRRAYQIEENKHRSCCERKKAGMISASGLKSASDANYD